MQDEERDGDGVMRPRQELNATNGRRRVFQTTNVTGARLWLDKPLHGSNSIPGVCAALAMGLAFAPVLSGAAAAANPTFPMIVSGGAAGCLPAAQGRVTIAPRGTVENLHVEVAKLPANTGFDFFVIQVPGAPFGMSWYQGDIHTDGSGNGVGDFVGRFSKETFVVAPGAAHAPTPFRGPPFPDANAKPGDAADPNVPSRAVV